MKLDRKGSTYVRAFVLPVLRRFVVFAAEEEGPDDCPVLLSG